MRRLLTAEAFEKHLKKSIKIAEHCNELNYHCRGVNCDNFVEIEGEVESFTCGSCGFANCVPCKALAHPGKTCAENQDESLKNLMDGLRLQQEYLQNEAAIEAEITAGTTMRCPRCTVAVLKEDGCDFLTCLTCKLNICWKTKKPRHDFTRGNGDIVEGCKCRDPPTLALCHPECGNCH